MSGSIYIDLSPYEIYILCISGCIKAHQPTIFPQHLPFLHSFGRKDASRLSIHVNTILGLFWGLFVIWDFHGGLACIR